MSKEAASTGELSALHALVSRVLTKQLQLADGALDREFSEEQLTLLTAALGDTKNALGAAITFLKNNNITASVEDNNELRQLQTELAATRARGKQKLSQTDLVEAAALFETATGTGLQ
jgi:hypothetical protein